MPLKKDLVAMFPDHRSALTMMHRAAASFMHCPRGHTLPHRGLAFGRCCPLVCADRAAISPFANVVHDPTFPYRAEMNMMPRGLEKEAYTQAVLDSPDAALHQAQAKEAMDLMNSLGILAARQAVHPIPELPPPPPRPEGMSARDYADKRLDQVLPIMVELEIFDAMYSRQPERRERAYKALMARAGVGEKRETAPDMRGPVQVLLQVGVQLPYDAQRTTNAGAPSNGRIIDAGNGSHLAPSAGGANPRSVPAAATGVDGAGLGQASAAQAGGASGVVAGDDAPVGVAVEGADGLRGRDGGLGEPLRRGPGRDDVGDSLRDGLALLREMYADAGRGD